MSSGEFPREGFAALVENVAGVAVYWADKGVPNPGQAQDAEPAWIELFVLSDVTVGDYEYRQVPNANNPDGLDSVIVAQGQITIQVRARSFDEETQAYELCKRVRMGLRSMTAAAWFEQHQVAYCDAHPIASFQTKVDTRYRLDANMDVVLNVVEGGDAEDDQGLTIGTVNGGGIIPGSVTGS